MFIKKRSFLFFVLILLSYRLYAFGDGNKLSDGSCQFERETGYQNSSLYSKGHESFLIVKGGDSRYRATEIVYNTQTCEKVTSGDAINSNFLGLMKKRGFQKLELGSNLHNMMDNSFHNMVNFTANEDNLKLSINLINSSFSKELQTLLSKISAKSIETNINISQSTQKLLLNKKFYTKYVNIINSLEANNINYKYTLKLNSMLQISSTMEQVLLNKFFNLTVKRIKDIPYWIESMKEFTKQNKISIFIPKILHLHDFGNNLTFNNFFTSIEYKYILKNLKVIEIQKIQDKDSIYGIELSYRYKNIRLIDKPTCTVGKIWESEYFCGYLDWGAPTFQYDDFSNCIGTYTQYNCKGNTSAIANIERQLMGTVKVATDLNKGWKFERQIKSRYK